jgi:hypothetical protein
VQEEGAEATTDLLFADVDHDGVSLPAIEKEKKRREKKSQS